MTQKFYPIGSWFSHHTHGKALLAQTGYNVGHFILINNGNRLTDEFKLQHHPEHSFPGVYQETISEYGLAPDQTLKERRELLEREISKLTKECGQSYLKMIKIPVVNHDDIEYVMYKDRVSRLTELKSELEIVIQLIEEGHD